jgi:hypothetical protein
MRALFLLLFAISVSYPHVQADATFAPAAPGSHSVSVRIHLHNAGDMGAAACRQGRRSRVTGVSPNGDDTVSFENLTNHKG